MQSYQEYARRKQKREQVRRFGGVVLQIVGGLFALYIFLCLMALALIASGEAGNHGGDAVTNSMRAIYQIIIK